MNLDERIAITLANKEAAYEDMVELLIDIVFDSSENGFEQ